MFMQVPESLEPYRARQAHSLARVARRAAAIALNETAQPFRCHDNHGSHSNSAQHHCPSRRKLSIIPRGHVLGLETCRFASPALFSATKKSNASDVEDVLAVFHPYKLAFDLRQFRPNQSSEGHTSLIGNVQRDHLTRFRIGLSCRLQRVAAGKTDCGT